MEQNGKCFLEELTLNDIKNTDYAIIKSTETGKNVTLEEYINICNCVACEAECSEIGIEEKAAVVAEIINRKKLMASQTLSTM